MYRLQTCYLLLIYPVVPITPNTGIAEEGTRQEEKGVGVQGGGGRMEEEEEEEEEDEERGE